AWIAVTPPRWSTFAQIGAHLGGNAVRYAAQFALWLVLFSVAVKTIGYRLSEFVPAFVFVYMLSLLIFVLGQWTAASVYGFEPPIVALLLGLLVSNVIGLPRRLDAGFRVEFYIKTGIVLLGATLPFTLIVWAGPVAILQASIVSLTTFFIIYAVARRLGLEQRFAATLGVGGAVCGVSAAIAISGAIGTRKEHSSIAIATVIVWAIVMIFLLPFVARLLELPAGIGGAWIGTSEFADAAGLAAAQSYGNLADNLPNIDGTGEQALSAFTLMKVVGRDVWIGIWAFVLAIVATTRCDRGRQSGRASLAALPEVRARLSDRVAARDRDRERLHVGGIRLARDAGLDRADPQFAHLGVHLLLLQHRAHDAVPRAREERHEAAARVRRGRRGQRATRLRAVGLDLRRPLAKPRSALSPRYLARPV